MPLSSSTRVSESRNDADNSQADAEHYSTGQASLDDEAGQAHSLFRNLKLNEAPCSLKWSNMNVQRRFKWVLQNGKRNAQDEAKIPYGSVWKTLSARQREKAEDIFQRHMMEQYRSGHCCVCCC